VGVGIIVFVTLSSWRLAYGLPSGGDYPPAFSLRDEAWYDSWGFNRNFFGGSDGFIPNVAYESLGHDKDRAYSIGEWFNANYARKVEMAEAILAYVQRWTDYGYDIDNVNMNGVFQDRVFKQVGLSGELPAHVLRPFEWECLGLRKPKGLRIYHAGALAERTGEVLHLVPTLAKRIQDVLDFLLWVHGCSDGVELGYVGWITSVVPFPGHHSSPFGFLWDRSDFADM